MILATVVSFMLTGQSNSLGWGTLQPQDLLADPAPIVVLTPEAGIRDSQEPWRGKGVGAGRSFARAILASDPTITQVWMISCGVGGTEIRQWLPNAVNTYMTECLTLAARAESFGAPVAGILWMQGEADSVNMDLAGMYGPRLRNVVNGFRAGIAHGDIPFLMSELPNNVPASAMPYRGVVDQQAEDMLASLANTSFIHTNDLTTMRVDTPVHWERGPLRIIGTRFAEAIQTLGFLH